MDTTSVALSSTTSGMSTTTAESVAALEENYDLFLSVLTAQLENQNPLDPTDTDEMTSQLIQYSQTEQQILTNRYLENLVLSTNNQAAETALAFIGKEVTYDASLQGFDGDSLSWSMAVPEDAEALTFEIYDENGLKVYETTDSSLPETDYAFAWNGATTGNGVALDGTYRLEATATLSDGSSVEVELQSSSCATEVVWTSGAPELVLANGDVIGLDRIVSAKAPDAA